MAVGSDDSTATEAPQAVSLTIDGRTVTAGAGLTVLQASLDAGVYIPHLCHHPDLRPVGVCGMCVVEIAGTEAPASACVTPVSESMVVHTQTERVLGLRRLAMELMLSRHPPECVSCTQYLNCELQSVKQFVGITEDLRVRKHPQPIAPDTGNPLFVRDMAKCVLCGRCVRACEELRGIAAISFVGTGRHTRTGPGEGTSLAATGCRFCGACVAVCPTGALRDKEDLVRGRSRRAALVPCRYTCPAEIDVPRYVRLAAQGDHSAATAVVREKAPFPLTLGYVCQHPCESVCRREEVDAAVAIKELKRHAAEHDDGSWKRRVRVAEATGRRVAVVGSGPAGLTAAYYLALRGHEVVVFEAHAEAGGMLRLGIPAYRLPREVLDAEIAVIVEAGVEIRVCTPVESLDALLDGGYEAVLVAVGAHVGTRLPIPGVDLGGTHAGVEFLRAVNAGEDVEVGERVVVLGGGNVAFDCARVARRLGAAEVHVACLECRDEMPATAEEVSDGEEEGIVVHDSRAFTGIAAEEGQACGVECLMVESFAFDDEGALEVDTAWGSEHVLAADTVILAVGQQPDIPDAWGLNAGPRGTVEIDSWSGEAGREGVFAAGDVVTGTATVIQAIASGRQAAAAVDRYLGGDGVIDERLAPETAVDPWFGPDPGFTGRSRVETPCVDADERLGGFCTILAGLDAQAAQAEASRCLRCDVRLTMTSVKYWGDY